MLIGEHAKQPIAGDIEAIVPWGYMGSIWVSFPPNNEETSCPVLQTPTIMYYNNQFYIFGEKFESFYTSEAGLAWKKANKSSLSLIRTGAKLILSQVKSNRNSEVEKPIPLY